MGQPPGRRRPRVLIDPEHYDLEPYHKPHFGCDQPDHFCFIYKNRGTGRYLSDKDGQTVPDRQVVLPDLDILQRQDAWSTIFVKRNERLIETRRSAEPFVYQTPKIQFANALHPVIDSVAPIPIADISAGSSRRSLLQNLQALFEALFADTETPTVVIQVEVSYDCVVHVQSVSLPCSRHAK